MCARSKKKEYLHRVSVKSLQIWWKDIRHDFIIPPISFPKTDIGGNRMKKQSFCPQIGGFDRYEDMVFFQSNK